MGVVDEVSHHLENGSPLQELGLIEGFGATLAQAAMDTLDALRERSGSGTS